MNEDEMLKVLKEAQSLRSHVENTMLALTNENKKDKAVLTYLTLVWTDVESLIEYVLD